MNYTVNTTKYSSFNVLQIGKYSFLLGKKEIASVVEAPGVDCKAIEVTFSDGTSEVHTYAANSKRKGGSKVMDNRSRNWKRRSC